MLKHKPALLTKTIYLSLKLKHCPMRAEILHSNTGGCTNLWYAVMENGTPSSIKGWPRLRVRLPNTIHFMEKFIDVLHEKITSFHYSVICRVLDKYTGFKHRHCCWAKEGHAGECFWVLPKNVGQVEQPPDFILLVLMIIWKLSDEARTIKHLWITRYHDR